MGEAISLITAVVSTVAAVIGTAVAVAQWRQTRGQPGPSALAPAPATMPAWPTTPGHQSVPGRASVPPPRQSQPVDLSHRPSRTVVVAVVLATVACVATAVSQFAYWSQQAAGSGNGASWEPLVDASVVVAFGSSFIGTLVALACVAVGLVRRRGRNVGLGLLALLGCAVPWIAVWILDSIMDR